MQYNYHFFDSVKLHNYIILCILLKNNRTLKKIVMKKIAVGIYTVGMLFLLSCGSNKSNTDELSAGVKEVSSQQSSTTSDPGSISTNLPAPDVQSQTSTTAISPEGQTPAGANAPGVRLNPAHGEPGHDCSIDVGKPLPASGSAKTNPAVQVNSAAAPATNTVVEIPPPAQTTGTKSGLNPAHGQPGHRCDIAEGAPLNGGAPASTATPTKNVVVQSSGLPQKISVPPVTNAPPSPIPAAGATGAGLNPAHGQPGHRCEIAVGAPLPKQ